VHTSAVARELKLSWGTAVYHLQVLERHGMLVARPTGRYRCFFAVGDPLADAPRALAVLRSRTARALAQAVAEEPGIVQKALCARVGVSAALASWHLARLEREEIVLVERGPRWTSYRAGPAWPRVEALLLERARDGTPQPGSRQPS
jgi:predicted transcriptional regulator